ncbi:putative plus-end-directed kinesin ATPase transcription factor C2H2 family [Lupinus albus]|uniref:Putative plus-end-directed kinesin ATPase transcription factor C2H2 family n=1 Tax=Lupinus albus TaxID=3870 RepID=A0A6A4QQ96_LUPAL|nr:putative plus-end-directed kinesin ATPase transcription factor C2H2 family [Lupinus albus]
MNGKLLHRTSSSSSSSSFINSGGGRSTTPSRGLTHRDSTYYDFGDSTSQLEFGMEEDIAEPLDSSSSHDSISVTIRFRPLSDREYQRGDEIAWYADDDKIVRNEYNPSTAYAYDRVFGPDTNTDEVYEVAAKPVVKAAMEGINGTVFAYGVTSSGKTHTMHGDQDSPGIIPLAIKDVFSIIQDVINDLLDPTGQNLRVREDAQGTYVEGMKEEVVLSPGHALSFIAAGEEHRHVGSNNFNLFSSRSHTIFTLMIESSADGDDYDGVIFSQLNLIDLAGSESSKTETTGLRRKEGSYINKSLLTLGTVIGKLSEGKASHVPYRDSKLTRLLQTSLSGNGHVSLICTVTPASSNMEETHNTLKFASRAKQVQVYASCNKIIDEKSLIKKYQREISVLKQELDQLKKGMLVGVSHEEITSLKQQLEEGQVKMRSRLEEEEDAKVALMSRIQRLTKLILVSSKNAIPEYLTDAPSPVGEDEKYDALHDGSLLIENESLKDVSTLSSDLSLDLRHRRSSRWNDEHSPTSSIITESIQVGELISRRRLTVGGMTMSDQMDLLVEQIKMLSGDIAFSTSTLKRLIEQSVNDPESSKTQIENLEQDIQQKRKQMRVLEQRISESGESSIANSSLVEIQQTITRLMTQCNEKAFELEIKSADNRVLQEQLNNKCSENRELHEKVKLLEQQLATVSSGTSFVLDDHHPYGEHIDGLKRKIQSQETENENLKLEQVQLSEENSGLHVQNQKLSEEASYAKELASAAAMELKNLAGEVTKLSLQKTKLEKDLMAARDLVNTRNAVVQTVNGVNRKYDANFGRKGRISCRGNEISGAGLDEFESWSQVDGLRIELQARKQREEALEAALAEKEFVEEEYRKKAEEAKKKEASLENDLASMWVLVAKLKKEVGAVPEAKIDNKNGDGQTHTDDWESNDVGSNTVPMKQIVDVSKSNNEVPKEEPLVARLKARMQEMKEKELKHLFNGDANSHVCKVCFESPTAAILLPCRHFCLCKSCSLACSECPVCRTDIADRLFTFTS